MTGDCLVRAARALLHEDTYELMVAPAIADLQFEPTVAAYRAAVASMAGAFADDFCADLRVIAEDLGMFATLIAIQASYYSAMLVLLVAHMRTDEALKMIAVGAPPQFFAVVLLVFTISVLPTLLCFWPTRRVTRTDT